jgi:hypothetical protein
MLGEKFQVFNYGFGGYGSHQMLALIESGRLDALSQRYKQIYTIYLTIAHHEIRCLDLWEFIVIRSNIHPPRYIFENGAIKLAGKYERTEFTKLLSYSRLIGRLRRAYHRHDYIAFHAPHSALDTHVAIITKSMQELHARYNAHALTVIYPDFTRIEPILQAHGIRTLSLADAMPDYVRGGNYEIRDDGHPTASTHTRIASALSEYILNHQQAAEE